MDAFQDDVKTFDSRGNSNITTPGGKRTVSGGFVQWKPNYSTWLEAGQRDPLRSLRAAFADSGDSAAWRPLVAEDHRRRDAGAGDVTPYVSYAEGYRAPVDHGNADLRASTRTGGGPPFFPCPDGTGRIVLLPAESEPAA